MNQTTPAFQDSNKFSPTHALQWNPFVRQSGWFEVTEGAT